MIKEAVAVGATIEDAQAAALLQLNAPLSADVQFEVITFPEKKVLGLFGGKQAEVKAYYEVEDEVVSPKQKETKASPKKQDNKKEVQKEVSKEVKTEKVEKTPEQKINLTVVSVDECPENVKLAYSYLKNMIEGIGVNGSTIEITNNESEYYFNITSEEDYSLLIGRRGETLDSIQYLVRLVANRGKDDSNFSKISINIGNYRQKRETTLKEIARKTAAKVRKYGRNIALDPMNPFERRIIHTEIAEIEDVISYSVGSDGDRKVIIALEEGVKPTNPRRNDNRRGGYNRGRGGRGRDDRRSETKIVESPLRAPRSDAEGLSRYGKIETTK